jgi:geranylgeranyl pyrophosphate synthase
MIKEVVLLDLVQHDLTRVEEKMHTISAGAYTPLAEAFLQLLASGGKRLRPALALAAYGFFGGEAPDRVIAMAAAVETLHTATLVHDDLIDNALVRRGVTTLNAVWNKGATVLAGDYLFACAAGFAAETDNTRVMQLFADTLRIIVEGELRQLFTSGQWRQPKDAYYPRILAKTASLFAAATRSGAILGDATREQEEALYHYGNDLGMAFQIVDDILDYASNEATLGKPVGGDLRQGIMTLPFFYFLQAHPDPEQVIRKLEEWSGNGSASRPEAIGEVIAQVRASDALRQATQEALDFAARAKQSLAIFPDSIYRQALSELTDFVVTRHV